MHSPQPDTAKAPATQADYMHRVLAVFAFDYTDALWWRVDGAYGPVTFFVRCNDLFCWGTSDIEPVTPEDVPLLERTAAEVAHIEGGAAWAGELYAARKRGQRPQGASYAEMPDALRPLFDACGEPRSTGLGNPRPHPDAPA